MLSEGKGDISTVDLIVLTHLDKLLLLLQTFFLLLYKTSYLYEEANRTEPSPSVRVTLLECWSQVILIFAIKRGRGTHRASFKQTKIFLANTDKITKDKHSSLFCNVSGKEQDL
jgi:hypothetical protein